MAPSCSPYPPPSSPSSSSPLPPPPPPPPPPHQHYYRRHLFQTKDLNLNPDLWLGVSFKGVALYKRGDVRPQCQFSYEK